MAFSAQNFAFHPEDSGEPQRMVQQGRNAIGCDVENLPAGAAGWRRAGGGGIRSKKIDLFFFLIFFPKQNCEKNLEEAFLNYFFSLQF